jgi:hypothetical protein
MFDTREFMRAKFEPRQEAVPVPTLAPWYKGDGAPAITVRGLTGPELARVREAAERHRAVGKLLEAVIGGNDKEKLAALRASMGIGDDEPDDYAKRVEMLTIAAVAPAMDLEVCVKLALTFPIEFYTLTSKITELTGMGHVVPGKPAPSTETAEFEQP